MRSFVSKTANGGVRSALIPLSEGALLLPNAVVAEVIGYRVPEPVEGVPDWYLGRVAWREKLLPVISFEKVLGRAAGEVGHRARIIIVYGLGGDGETLPYYAILARTIPRLSQVSAVNIEEHPDDGQHDAVAAHVLVDGEEAWIPNVDALTNMINEASL